jgi:hypothetical protein
MWPCYDSSFLHKRFLKSGVSGSSITICSGSNYLLDTHDDSVLNIGWI